MMLELHVTDERKSRISELPYDIVVSIISFLTIKEAIATSVLSRRWRHMWTYTTGSWRFNLFELLCDYNHYVKYGGEDYVMRVNQALESHRGPFLYELSFGMSQTFCLLASYYTSIIDNWISIASRKCVRRLDLNMPSVNLNEIVQTLPVFSQLTHLSLKSVQVTEETLCYFLSNSLLLEYLCVIDSDQLVNLKVCGGSSLKLKHLEISNCMRLESLEISAPNLVSFACKGLFANTLLKDVPLLSTLSIGPSFLSNLWIIKPGLDESGLTQPDLLLSNLKHLEFIIGEFLLNSFLPFTYLLKACPLLSSLKINLGMIRLNLTESREKFVAPVNEAIIYRHQCLRMVTLCGFIGHPRDTELALHLIGIATSLGKMVIDCSRETPYLALESLRKERSIARQSAEELRSKLPPAIELVVL